MIVLSAASADRTIVPPSAVVAIASDVSRDEFLHDNLFLSVPYAKNAAFSAYRAQLCFVGFGFGDRVILP
jgi:hypothetical protein